MNQPGTAVSLNDALRAMLRHPLGVLRDWNWKAAAFSALVRGALFFLVNRHQGRASAEKAMLVEVFYATAAAGLAGAVTQRLRHAHPRGRSAIVVLLVIPLIMLSGQAAVHSTMGTPRLRFGLLLSFVFASLATGFNWLAMRHGVFVTGAPHSFLQDLVNLPRLLQVIATSGRMRTAEMAPEAAHIAGSRATGYSAHGKSDL